MEDSNRSGFWKTAIPVFLLIVVLSALGIYGITSFLKAVSAWRGQQTNAAASDQETAAPTPAPTPYETDSEGKIITVDRNQNPFLNRMGELEELFVANMVLDYDLDEMHEAAFRAYIETAGENWDDYRDAHPDYGENVTLIRREDSEFLDRLGEIEEMMDQRRADVPDMPDAAVCEDAAYRAFVDASGDDYSAYLTEEEWEDMLESSSGSYCGIGVQISQNKETLVSEVVTVFSNSPALEAGMKAGDVFIAVNGEDVTQMALDEIVTRVRGEEGTRVQITVYRAATDETLTLDCERRQVQVDTVYSRMLTDNVGYIQLTEFDEVSVTQIKSAVTDLKKEGMTKLVFDLRNNPGGLLSSVLSIADFFVKSNVVIFRMEYVDGEVYTEKSHNSPIFEGDMVVLVNGNSASASEVFTGIMQDYGRAVIMGTQTFGKGIVQSFFTLDDGGALKTTIAHYFSPLGRDFHGVGITPDIIGEDDVLTDDDELLDQALEQMK